MTARVQNVVVQLSHLPFCHHSKNKMDRQICDSNFREAVVLRVNNLKRTKDQNWCQIAKVSRNGGDRQGHL